MTCIRFNRLFSSKEDFDDCTRDVTVHLGKDTGHVTLAGSVLLADETGRILLPKGEQLSRFVWARKEFILENTAFRAARLVCYLYEHHGNSSPLYIEVNGHPVTLPANSGYQGWNIWYAIPVPVECFRPGKNEITFHSAGVCFDSWRLGVENGNLLNRSAKSIDGGQTWRYDLMGYDDSQKGEYLVRLQLEQFAPKGAITSQIIALSLDEDIIKRPVVGGKVTVKAEVIAPRGTEVTLRVRQGCTPLPEPEHWTDWQIVAEDAGFDVTGYRFLQWRATLTTSDPLSSPILKAVAVEGSLELGRKTSGLSVLEFDSSEIVESSFPFAYQDHREPKLAILRQREKLDQVVSGAESEWEKLLFLRTWVSRQWHVVGNPLVYCPWDALVILDWKRRLGDEARAACVHYAVVFCQCCLALGLQARLVLLARYRTVHDLGHMLAEIWSNRHGKWIVFDPEFDIHFERDGVPLNALELHQIWMRGETDKVVQVAGPGNMGEHPLPSDWTLEGFRDGLFRYFALVLRNDHLTSLQPGGVDHGWLTFRWTGFLWWGETIPEEQPQFPLHSSRIADFYWPLGQVAIDLQWEQEDTLLVHLATCLPNFCCFEVQIDDGPWQESEANFSWRLHPGENGLRARARNAFGLSGRESYVKLAWEAAEGTSRRGE